MSNFYASMALGYLLDCYKISKKLFDELDSEFDKVDWDSDDTDTITEFGWLKPLISHIRYQLVEVRDLRKKMLTKREELNEAEEEKVLEVIWLRKFIMESSRDEFYIRVLENGNPHRDVLLKLSEWENIYKDIAEIKIWEDPFL